MLAMANDLGGFDSRSHAHVIPFDFENHHCTQARIVNAQKAFSTQRAESLNYYSADRLKNKLLHVTGQVDLADRLSHDRKAFSYAEQFN